MLLSFENKAALFKKVYIVNGEQCFLSCHLKIKLCCLNYECMTIILYNQKLRIVSYNIDFIFKLITILSIYYIFACNK